MSDNERNKMSEKDMQGVLFVNTEKEAENEYDHEGFAMVNGTRVWVNAWVRTPKEGGKPPYLALRFKNKPDGPK